MLVVLLQLQKCPWCKGCVYFPRYFFGEIGKATPAFFRILRSMRNQLNIIGTPFFNLSLAIEEPQGPTGRSLGSSAT
jgi:hypothetical protein